MKMTKKNEKRSFFNGNRLKKTVVFKPIVFKKLDVSLTIVDEPSLTIVNDDTSLTIVNDDP